MLPVESTTPDAPPSGPEYAVELLEGTIMPKLAEAQLDPQIEEMLAAALAAPSPEGVRPAIEPSSARERFVELLPRANGDQDAW